MQKNMSTSEWEKRRRVALPAGRCFLPVVKRKNLHVMWADVKQYRRKLCVGLTSIIGRNCP